MIIDFTEYGRCSRCGQCCTDFLIMTEDEITQIREYLDSHPESRIETVAGTICPFHDMSSRSCRIYPVRPLVCRLFLCRKGERHANRIKRELLKREGCVYDRSLHSIFFDNPVNDWIIDRVEKDLHG